MLKNAEDIILKNGIHSIKIDTHRLNVPMTKTLYKLNYSFCGIIKLLRTEEDNLRDAYEKLI